MRKKIIRVLLIVLAVFAIVVLSVSLLYEAQVKKTIISEINKQIVTPIKVGEIKFTIFSSFPNASLEFNDVRAQSAYKDSTGSSACSQDLFFAKNISLQFNIWNLISKNYTLKKLVLKGVTLNIFIDKNGADNYHFWKENKSENSGDVNFKLSHIAIEVSDVNYINLQSNIKTNFVINTSSLNGEIYNKDFSLESNSSIYLQQLFIDDKNFVNKKDFVLTLNINKKGDDIFLSKTIVEIQKMQFDATGNFNISKAKNSINVHLTGNKLDIKSFLSLLPNHLKTKMDNYVSTGKFNADIHLTGSLASPAITANVGISNGTIIEKIHNVKINNFSFKGSFKNGDAHNLRTSSIKINTCKGSIGKNNFIIDGYLHNLQNPFLDLNLNASVDLKDIKQFFGLNSFQKFDGDLQVKLNVSCPLDLLMKGKLPYKTNGEIAGNLVLNNGEFQMQDDEKVYSHVNTELHINNNIVDINHLDLTCGSTNVSLTGVFKNYFSLLDSSLQHPQLIANVKLNNLNIPEWTKENKVSKQKPESKSIAINKIDFVLKTSIANLKYNGFNATDINSVIVFKNELLRFDSLSFNAMSGKLKGNATLDFKRGNGFSLICDADVQKINITKMFSELNNFTQQTLTDKNISGELNAQVKLKSDWDKNSNIKPESIVADADIKITNGVLKDFAPMNNLSKFIELSELKNVRFTKLENKININNKKIFIPEFEINSSALNLTCSGTHNFDNYIDYHFKVMLSELLSKKRKQKTKQADDDYTEIDTDSKSKTTLFISMKGDVNNPEIKFDKKELGKHVKNEFANEKKTIGNLFRQEFGSSKSKTPKEKTEALNKNTGGFQIEWEEEKPATTPNTTPKKEEKTNPKSPKAKSKKEKTENADDYL